MKNDKKHDHYSTALDQVLAGGTEVNHKKPWHRYLLPKLTFKPRSSWTWNWHAIHTTTTLHILLLNRLSYQQFNNLNILSHDTQKTDFWGQRSVAEASLAMQWLVKRRFVSMYMHNRWETSGGSVLQFVLNLLIYSETWQCVSEDRISKELARSDIMNCERL